MAGFLNTSTELNMSKFWSGAALLVWGGSMLIELWVTRFDTNLENPSASTIQTVMTMLSVALFVFAVFMWQRFNIGQHVKTEFVFLILGIAYTVIWAFSNLWVSDDAKLKPSGMGHIAIARLVFWSGNVFVVLVLLLNTIHRWRLSRAAAAASSSSAPVDQMAYSS
jgi:hypothetical protein